MTMNKKLTFLITFLVFFMGLTTTVVCQDLSEGLVGYWPLDEDAGATTVDQSGNGSEGQLHGEPSWVEGVFESALEFDGVDDYVDCGDDIILEFGPGDFSVSAWIYTSGPASPAGGTSEDQSVFAKGGDDGGGIRYHMTLPGNTVVFLTDANDDAGGKGKYDPNGTIPVVDSAWHHIVGYRDGNTLRLYVDGVEDMGVTNHTESTLPADYSITPTVHPAIIGAITSNNEGFPINKYFHGIIDDVAVWNRALTLDEITFLYNDGLGNPVLPKVSSSSDIVLGEFVLHQNYPNPFNSLTTFSFELPENSDTKLIVYNSLGQEVAVLVNGMRSAGIYKEQFDGSRLAGGVYYATFQTGLYSRTIKMLLTK